MNKIKEWWGKMSGDKHFRNFYFLFAFSFVIWLMKTLPDSPIKDGILAQIYLGILISVISFYMGSYFSRTIFPYLRPHDMKEFEEIKFAVLVRFGMISMIQMTFAVVLIYG